MTDDEFDLALITAAFALGAEQGWRHVTPAAAARHAGLDLAAARKYPATHHLLAKFGHFADRHAITGALTEGHPKDRLFDILLRRFDFLQTHRTGVLALTRHLATHPELTAYLAKETVESMGWMLEATALASPGIRGELRKQGLALVWGWGLRAWLKDESADLSATMAAVDVALARADQIAGRFSPEGFTPETESTMTEPELPLDMPD
jgi:AcrR family transcriptional regulator